MDVRRVKWFLTWKGGVELHLYEFQLAQSKLRLPITVAKPTQKPITPTALQLYDVQLAQSQQHVSIQDTEYTDNNETAYITPYDVPVNAWEDINLLTGSHDSPLEDCSPVLNRLSVPASLENNAPVVLNTPGVQTAKVTLATPASTFMRERPLGPVQNTNKQLKVLARSVSAKVKQKGTTTPQGRAAIQSVATQAGKNNKENEPGPKPTKTRKVTSTTPVPTNKTKQNKRQKVTAPTQRKKKMSEKDTVPVRTEPLPVCTYGCSHGGLVGLKQMMPYDTKFCLEKGNYFDSKCCVDCKKSIAAVFESTKNKALLYYCPIDYNVHNLRDDNDAVAETHCACILCIACYFGREGKKTAAAGKGTRSSRRGLK